MGPGPGKGYSRQGVRDLDALGLAVQHPQLQSRRRHKVIPQTARGVSSMKLRQQQSGMSLLGMLAIAIMVGFFVMCGLKMGPSYFEYLTIRDVVTRVAAEHDPATD